MASRVDLAAQRAIEATATARAAEVTAVRAENEKAIKKEVATVRAEAEKAKKDEFGAGFFQGYSNLKMRVALAHLEWDLTAFSKFDSDY